MGHRSTQPIPMMELSPVVVVPFVLSLVAAFAAMMFARRRSDGRPFSLVAAVLYAVAAGCFLLGIIFWSMRVYV